MSSGLELFNQILFLNLRPWLQGQVSEQKYLVLLQEVQKEHYQFQPLFKIDFPKPLTAKRKYYYSLIENEAIKYFNTVHAHVANASSNGKRYRLNDYISKKLNPKLKEVQKVIEDFGYTSEAINARNNANNYESLRDNSFIIQFLKLQVIRLYLEIQNAFADLMNEDPLTEVDIRLNFFFEDSIEKLHLTDADKIALPNLNKKAVVAPILKEFNVQKREIGTRPTGGLSYDELVKNKDTFAAVEKELFDKEIINGQYEFIETQGNQKLLAAVFQTLSRKKYFNEFYFPGKRPIKSIHIRKFMNQRYQTVIDKEFRNFNEDKLLQAYLIKHVWVTSLPSC